MVELQSCAPLVNAYALGAIEEEMRGDGVNVISEISAELEKERQKNAELMQRIRILEAEIKKREKEFPRIDGQGCCSNAMERRFKKFKRQKLEPTSNRIEDRNIIPSEMASQEKHHKQCLGLKEPIPEGLVVNWMSIEETQFLHLEKVKDGDLGDPDETDDSHDEGDDYREEVGINYSRIVSELKCEAVDKGSDVQCAKDCSGAGELVIPNVNQQNELSDAVPVCNEIENRHQNKKEPNDLGSYKVPPNTLTLEKEFLCTGSGSVSQQKKRSKVAFCPKEVNRIIDSEALMQKNAQSHTIRKIIVFASLGIRHGCEDIFELNFNHFTILRKGEPYMSPKDPGEHVLYENPGVRRKVFYPNQHSPTLCPVQILEEEKAMRPSDPSCPSWLFLCIKYGGRTRNLPQNEYVRQRMGRNKLESFGPLTCQMAMLIHIRSGSFFFKALGITLLFMAGFPDDLVQRETKYRNLDLIQKYYRTDEDAKGEELFLPRQMPCETASPGSQQLCGKICSTKTKGKKKQNQRDSKPRSMQGSAFPQISSSALSTQWQAHATATLQSMPSPYQTPLDTPAISNTTMIGNACTNSITFPSQTPYHIFPPQPAVNTFVPVVYWPPPNAFSPRSYQSSFGYQSFPSAGNYLVHPQPYYNHPSSSRLIPKMGEAAVKNGTASEGADSDYDCVEAEIVLAAKNFHNSCKQ